MAAAETRNFRALLERIGFNNATIDTIVDEGFTTISTLGDYERQTSM